MATFKQLASGNWRVQIRRKRSYVSETFRRHRDAEEWALATERKIDLGGSLASTIPAELDDAFASNVLEGYLKLVVSHAAAVHGIPVQVEPINLARIALKRLGLVGKARERDRRPTQDELDRLIQHFETSLRQLIPVARIIRFAVATAMRQDEICRILWEDIDPENRTVVVRDRKDPRDKEGNHQKVPLIDNTGFDAWSILREQKPFAGRSIRVFPYNSKSVSVAFTRACQQLKIKDLRFHDLRHEATTRLFEAGFRIEQVALVTGHKDWKMLKRYTNLRPEHLHRATNLAHSQPQNRSRLPEVRSAAHPHATLTAIDASNAHPIGANGLTSGPATTELYINT